MFTLAGDFFIFIKHQQSKLIAAVGSLVNYNSFRLFSMHSHLVGVVA